MQESDIRQMSDVTKQFDYMAEDVQRMFLTEAGDLRPERVATTPCVVCGSEQAEELFVKLSFPYLRCPRCSMVFISPRPLPNYLEAYYQTSKSFNYFVTKTMTDTRRARQEKIMRVRANRLIASLQRHTSASHLRVLEVGSGSGIFSQEVMNAIPEGLSIDIVGVEPSPAAAQQAAALGFTVFECTLENLPVGQLEPFDAIISFEVIEHLFDPAAFIESSKQLLKPGGLLYFTTPNVEGFDNQMLGPAAPTFCPPHLNLFSPRSVEAFLRRHGCMLLDLTTPGELDVSVVLNRKESWTSPALRPFLDLLAGADDATQKAFQKLLQQLTISSHMAVLASVKTTGQ